MKVITFYSEVYTSHILCYFIFYYGCITSVSLISKYIGFLPFVLKRMIYNISKYESRVNFTFEFNVTSKYIINLNIL